MNRKPLWRISVATTLEAEDLVTELLGRIFNRSATSYFDIETQTSVVSVYFSEKGFLARPVREVIYAGLKRIKSYGLKIGACKIKTAKVRREDWTESWKRHFKPIEIKFVNRRGGPCKPVTLPDKTRRRGTPPCEKKSLLVKPSWSKKRARPNQAIVILDPGLSFGTGQHPTTAFCLREIVRCRKIGARQSFLDIGSGSGILTIAAAKLDYQPICALDFDPEATRIAQANARVNGVDGKIRITRDDVTKLSTKLKGQFDLVCANLISNLLIAERKRIAAQLKPGGVLVLAGILKSEFSEVRREFESLGLKLFFAESKNEWRSGSFGFRARKSFER
jgi:ribosomal protein L11 methyltransferase